MNKKQKLKKPSFVFTYNETDHCGKATGVVTVTVQNPTDIFVLLNSIKNFLTLAGYFTEGKELDFVERDIVVPDDKPSSSDVVIVVHNGVVTNVYSHNDDVNVQIIDLDSQEESELSPSDILDKLELRYVDLNVSEFNTDEL